jgi:hypothetical protein
MPSTENPYAGQGPVLLDVGGAVGALLVRMPSSMEGVEIEIRPQRATQQPTRQPAESLNPPPHAHLIHVEVLARPTPAGFVSCAVFPELMEGQYELYERPSGPVRLRVSIAGGQVTQASWPLKGPPDRPEGGLVRDSGDDLPQPNGG